MNSPINLLTCSRRCRHQKDGYCTMEGIQPVQRLGNGCPYFVDSKDALPSAQEQLDRLSKTGNRDQLDLWFKA